MKRQEIPHWRLRSQGLAQPAFALPEAVVAWLGAVQAQDYPFALWAIGLRMQAAVEPAIEQAIAARRIVRTWPMRGTLHFVTLADVRWMLKLLTPRVVAANAGRLRRQYELDEAALGQCREVVERALHGGRRLTREALYAALEAAHIATANQRGLHILWRLAHDGVICFGPREGKQHTLVLLDEWVPGDTALQREEALRELARRYCTSHGPATVADFAWWSGLPAADARAGLELARGELAEEVLEGQTYWRAPTLPEPADAPRMAYLLPDYDEYVVGYTDRSAVLDPAHTRFANSRDGILNPAMVFDGRVVGTWKRTVQKGTVRITPRPFDPLTRAQTRAFAAAAERYGAFLGLPVVMA